MKRILTILTTILLISMSPVEGVSRTSLSSISETAGPGVCLQTRKGEKAAGGSEANKGVEPPQMGKSAEVQHTPSTDRISIDKLWKEYEEAERRDKPQEELRVLRKIKAEAGEKRLAWDYYRALKCEVEVGTRVNWKDWEKLRKQMTEDVEAYDEPVMTLYHCYEYGSKTAAQTIAFAKEEKARLSSGFHKEFAQNDWRVSRGGWQDALMNTFKTDYDYVVWVLRMEDEAAKLFKDRYPLNALFELEDGKGPGKDFEQRYAGKAVCLAVEKKRLEEKFRAMTVGKVATSEDFKAFREEVQAFENRRATFKGDEKLIADNCSCKSIIEELDAKAVECSISDGALTAVFRNTQSADFVIKKSKDTIYEKKLINGRGSYYVYDTLRVKLPEIADGEYTTEWTAKGCEKQEGSYTKYTISLASHNDSRGVAVFVTDYLTGKPFDKADFILYDRKDEKVAEAKDVKLSPDGFTYLPEELEKQIKKDGDKLRLQCRVADRLSGKTYIGSWYQPDLSNGSNLECVVITDRRAFNPGETVNFKCIVTKGSYQKTCVGAGTKLTVELSDAQGNKISEQTLKTDKWGSADGKFLLERRDRNGSYSIRVYAGGSYIGQTSVVVDDFVLPTFDLIFDDTPTNLTLPVDSVGVSGSIVSYSGKPMDAATVRYSISHNGDNVEDGTISLGGDGRFALSVPFKGSEDEWWHHYQFCITVADGTGETQEYCRSISVSRPWRDEPADDAPKPYSFRNIEDSPLGISVTAGTQPVWMSVEVYGQGDVLLSRSLKQFAPAKDGDFAACDIRIDHKDSWPQTVTLQLLYFQNSNCYQTSRTDVREDHSLDLPLTFERFTDVAGPSSRCSLGIQTLPGVQCAVAVFDKSTEQICANTWGVLRNMAYPAPYVWASTAVGRDRSSHWATYRSYAMGTKMMVANTAMAKTDDMMMDAAPEMEEATMASGSDNGADVPIRTVFANTIAWEPCLQTDAEGRASFDFTTSDKLSTYCVQIFAQDVQMRNAVLRREMMVTLPVQISIVQPEFLYAGDKYTAAVTLSNSTDTTVSGTLEIAGTKMPATVPARSSVSFSADVQVPASAGSVAAAGPYAVTSSISILARFIPDDAAMGADAVRVSVPVLPNWQNLTEAHSAVLLYGMSRDSLVNVLRSQFVNIPGSAATVTERDIRQMVMDALPSEVVPRSDNIVDLCRAAHARVLLGQPAGEDLLKKIDACRCSEGGFSWFPGMDPSPILTAYVLVELEGILTSPESAVKYLDKVMTSRDERPLWRGWLTMEQYMSVRSRYVQVPFDCRFSAAQKKAARAYLVPAKTRGLNGYLFAKARRVLTLRALLASDEGIALTKAWGVRLCTSGRLARSQAADEESLAQYAVAHKSGGVYFPNLVMPWRGLLESEVYAHSMMCHLFDGTSHQDIADGIRLWLMVQKETQCWSGESAAVSDPGYIIALQTILEGSEEILSTRVIALSASFNKPFADVLEAGNGFTIDASAPVKVSVAADASGLLKVGDKVKVTYKVWSEENRSFVRVTLPMPASLRPVRQLSGFAWRLAPGSFAGTANAYRSVLDDRIEYWLDVCPEENITITEEFFVTQAGTFQCPAPSVESLYAPHYRANSAALPLLISIQ